MHKLLINAPNNTIPLSPYAKFHLVLHGYAIWYKGHEIDKAEAFARWPKSAHDIKAGLVAGVSVVRKNLRS